MVGTLSVALMAQKQLQKDLMRIKRVANKSASLQLDLRAFSNTGEGRRFAAEGGREASQGLAADSHVPVPTWTV